MAYVLWKHFLRHNPSNPKWPARDRFVLSAGHGSMLLYALLHLTGYPLTLDEIKRFRQWGSHTPGHPEHDSRIGIETTTGPLGQGFANGVGMAMAEKYLAHRFNKPDYPLFDYGVYAVCSDGDIMEGVSSEAASMAGHLLLGNIVYLYSDNKITIEGSTDIAFSEDVGRKFEALGWHVQHVGGNDLDAIAKAIESAKAETTRPSIIIARTIIGFGSPGKQDTAEVHGAPLGIVQYGLLALGAAKEAAAAAVVHLGFLAYHIAATDGTGTGHAKVCDIRRPLVMLKRLRVQHTLRPSYHLRNHISGFLQDHCVSDPHIKPFNLVLIVKRRSGDHRAGD